MIVALCRRVSTGENHLTPIFLLHSFSYFIALEVKLNNQEHSVTVEAGQNNPLGQELKVIDQSILGKGVTVEKTTPLKK